MNHNSSTVNVSGMTRRDFLKITARLGLSAAGMALLEACGAKFAAPAAEETLETTTIRMGKISSICYASQYLAEDLLKSEGFTDVQYNEVETTIGPSLAADEVDINMFFVAPGVIDIDAGNPVVALAGVHVGCFEVFASDQVNTIQDLKGKTIPIGEFGGPLYTFLTSVLAHGGIDTATEINWLSGQKSSDMPQLLADGKVDAVLAFPPLAQEMHAKKIGHVVLNSMMDKPWSQYFCCLVFGNKGFVQKNPVATKRAVRAILKASDIVASEPERAARFIVDKGYTTNYDYALEAMQNIPYNKWAEYDPTDTVRFYALRLREAGLIKSTPEEIIAKGTDWSFLNELKVELKG